MSDNDHTFAAGLQLGQEVGIENFFILRVLICGPLVEYIDRAIFQVSGEQRQPSALSLREGGGRQPAISHLDLVLKLEQG